jgi:hypothetical protein
MVPGWVRYSAFAVQMDLAKDMALAAVKKEEPLI